LNLLQAFLELGHDRRLNFGAAEPKELDNGLACLAEKLG
jgi:hypothetical protein